MLYVGDVLTNSRYIEVCSILGINLSKTVVLEYIIMCDYVKKIKRRCFQKRKLGHRRYKK